MRFLLADSFTGALARLPTAEAKAVKTTVVDLQIDPTGKGLSFHRIDKSKDANFWSVRVGRDLRLAVRANTSPPLARASEIGAAERAVFRLVETVAAPDIGRRDHQPQRGFRDP